MTKTKCIHCKEEFDRWDAYAKHILEKHPEDKLRVEWARSCLAEPTSEVPPKKIRGRLIDRISPKRLPKYLREQLNEKTADVPTYCQICRRMNGEHDDGCPNS